MKKITLLSTIFIILSLGSYAQKTNFIQGTIKELGNDSLIVVAVNLNVNEAPQFDTIKATESQFKYYPKSKGELLEIIIIPTKLISHFESGRTYIPKTAMIELIIKSSDTATIQGEITDNYLDYTVEGSSINKAAALIRKSYKNLNLQAVSYEVTRANLPNDINKIKKSKELFAKRISVTSKINEIKVNFIKSHPESQLSAYYLIKQPIANFGTLYPSLSQQVRNGSFKSVLENKYQQFIKFTNTNKAEQNIKIGLIAPTFILKDVHGNSINLNNFKNKKDIIVIDFWGSWCGWCIEEFPKLQSYYKRHQDKMAIIGIACADTEENWKKALQEHKLPWINLINDDNNNDISVLYGVKAFPTKIVLNSDLKIIGIYKGVTEDFLKKLDELTSNNQDEG